MPSEITNEPCTWTGAVAKEERYKSEGRMTRPTNPPPEVLRAGARELRDRAAVYQSTGPRSRVETIVEAARYLESKADQKGRMLNASKLTTDTQMARRLGVSSAWIRREARAGRLPHLKADGRYLFDHDLVERVLLERAQGKASRGEP